MNSRLFNRIKISDFGHFTVSINRSKNLSKIFKDRTIADAIGLPYININYLEDYLKNISLYVKIYKIYYPRIIIYDFQENSLYQTLIIEYTNRQNQMVTNSLCIDIPTFELEKMVI